MMHEFIKAFVLIFIAEMGDKTQILAMAFATKYPVKKVLMGIFIGSFLNHGLAVILGSYISTLIPVNTVQIIAGFAFVGFALWTLKAEDEEEEEEKQKLKFGPIITVAIAFFIGELGDKTQLSVITLSTDAVYSVAILGGAVLGMIVTGGIGIIIGKKVGDKIPEVAIKIIASTVFMFFGITKLYQTVPKNYLNIQNISLFISVIIIIAVLMISPMMKRRKEGQQSNLLRKSKELYDYYRQVGENIQNICLGPDKCGSCKGDHCIIGYTKSLINNGLNEGEQLRPNTSTLEEIEINKPYDKDLALESLIMTLVLVKKNPDNTEYNNIHEIRRRLEVILFGKSIESMNNWLEYTSSLSDINKEIANNVIQCMEN